MEPSRLPFRAAPKFQTAARPSKTPCRFFTQGACRNGGACWFSHDAGTAARQEEARQPAEEGVTYRPESSEDTRALVPCRYYLAGSCLKGDICPSAHPSTDGTAAECQDVVGKDKEAKPDETRTRVLRGAVVRFGDGATVTKTSLRSDFSAVRLSNLPPDSSPATIATLLSQLGLAVPPSCIRLLPPQTLPTPNPPGTSTTTADIRLEDPSFAPTLCAALATNPPQANNLTAVPIPAPPPPGLTSSSSSSRASCRKAHVSWHQPFRLAWLNFGAEHAAAQDVHDQFAAGVYTVLGQAVTSNLSSSRSRSSAGHYRGRMRTTTWTVTLADVPGRAGKRDVLRCVPREVVKELAGPVELGEPSYGCGLEEANAVVKGMLGGVGAGLERWEGAPLLGGGGKRAKVTAWFWGEGDAAVAAAALNEAVLPFGRRGKVKLTVQPVYSARFKVLDRVYKAVEEEILGQSRAWLGKYVFFAPYEPAGPYRVLRIEGEKNTDVADAKQALEGILEGEVAKIGHEILWAPSFGVNGQAYSKIKDMERTLGIVILRDKKRRLLRLYGPPAKRAEAQSSMAALAKEDSGTTGAIELSDTAFAWACRGGFREMVKALGPIVAFDIIPTPKRIVVTGSEKDYELAREMVKNGKAAAEAGEGLVAAADCAICWTEAENPIHTKCGHTYCSDCFETFAFSGGKAGADIFSVRCEGDASSCKTALTLDELEEHLSSQSFDEVLEASFNFYLRRRPEMFHYCPTADCGQVYRTSKSGVVFACPNCMWTVCTSCHASHQGKTCAEHKYLLSDAHWEEVKGKLGIKECPKCKTAIEKTYGCDHMTCGGCGTHICWRCLAVFDTAEGCYDHMSAAHGRFG